MRLFCKNWKLHLGVDNARGPSIDIARQWSWRGKEVKRKGSEMKFVMNKKAPYCRLPQWGCRGACLVSGNNCVSLTSRQAAPHLVFMSSIWWRTQYETTLWIPERADHWIWKLLLLLKHTQHFPLTRYHWNRRRQPIRFDHCSQHPKNHGDYVPICVFRTWILPS